jgi:carbonic anhydrase
MKTALWMSVVLVIAAVLTPSGGSGAQDADYSHYVSPWKTHWDYEGPRGAAHWSTLDPAYALCNAGKEQSPIDIENTQKAKLPALQFEYKTALATPTKWASVWAAPIPGSV